MQNGSTQTDALRAFEIGFDGDAIRKETNSAQRVAVRRLDCDSHFAESGDCIRHETFTAGFVDWRLGAVTDGDGESPAA
jgi:hypothetical protein